MVMGGGLDLLGNSAFSIVQNDMNGNVTVSLP
jgi:hypothetical protein